MKRSSTHKSRETFARNLKRVRTELGLSQERLAELTGLHRTYVSSVERGERNVSIDNMGLIAEAMSIPLHELLKDE